MTAAIEHTEPRIDRRAIRNVAALATAQSILGSQLALHIIFGPLVGASLAPSPLWATAPVSVTIIANMATAAPISMLHGRIGRRLGFLLGALSGACGGALAIHAITEQSFGLFLLASCFLGVYQANQNLIRFAATDTASDRFRPTAMSLVLAGGLFNAFLAPLLAANFQDALAPIPLAGIYAAIIGVNAVGAIPLMLIDIPRPSRLRRGEGPPFFSALRRVFAQRDAKVALLCGMVSYALMALVMTSTSSAMVYCGFSNAEASQVVGAHVFAMFAPSFVTGPLIARFGHRPIIALGLAMLAGCAAIAMTGVEIEQFYAALILLGVGWNFGFIGASSLLTTTYRPEERSAVQGANDTLVVGLMAVASLSSGQLFHGFGWEVVNLAMTPFLALTALALAWSALAARRERAAGG